MTVFRDKLCHFAVKEYRLYGRVDLCEILLCSYHKAGMFLKFVYFVTELCIR